MKQIYKTMMERLENKRNELEDRQEQFDVMWHSEKHSGCFERNAINDLLIMQQLKTEISELEHWETLIRVQMGKAQ